MGLRENSVMVVGDITNFLLTGTYSAADQTSEAGKPYLRAQAEGQVSPVTARADQVVIISVTALRGLHQLPVRLPGLLL